MQIHLGSRHLAADVAVALDVRGQQHLVIAAKATWSLPQPGQRPRPLDPQPLVLTDAYHGTPGDSAMRYGADMARFKPRCDVLFDACAHSPDGRPVRELLAQVQVGGLHKKLRVLGPRRWQRTRGTWRLGEPEPFTQMPLHHGLAFGGTRWYQVQGRRVCEAQPENPAGLGFAGRQTQGQMDGQPAPCLEDPADPVRQPDGPHRPHALGAIGRHWQPRRQFAGTYDEAWQRDVFPLLPLDFDEQFHQCAPADQQIPYPQGGEAVRLLHVLPGRPEAAFSLPPLQMQVRVLRADYSVEVPAAPVDTLFFETGPQRFSAVWRASVPLRRGVQEISVVAVGPVDPQWWQERISGRRGKGCWSCNDAQSPEEVA